LEQKNKMVDKMKMAAKHEFSKLNQFLCKSIETWDLEETSYKKNNVEVTFFKSSKWQIEALWRQQPLLFLLALTQSFLS
jgi:hypothetical protein